MKYASATFFALTLAAIGFAACASGENDLPFNNGDTSGGGGNGGESSGGNGTGGSGTTTTGSGSSTSSGGNDAGGVCVPKCATDADCQGSCPTPKSGTTCCDTATNVCYVSNSATCPVANDGGMPPPMY